ncbi:MAG: NUDIX hydrolase [Clostridiales bacterium]|nr:NUDIX hydrolase [Clostridiales bacterium]
MIVRNCAGGLVFCGDKVLLIRNDKHEWSFPKGVSKPGERLVDVARTRVNIETGVDAKVISPCGKTSYEFFSASRGKPVHNNISWFVMSASSDECRANVEEGIVDCKFFTIEEAMDNVTYSQDKSLLTIAFQKMREQN